MLSGAAITLRVVWALRVIAVGRPLGCALLSGAAITLRVVWALRVIAVAYQ